MIKGRPQALMLRRRGSTAWLWLLTASAIWPACEGPESVPPVVATFHSSDRAVVPFPSDRLTVAADTLTGRRPRLSAALPPGDALLRRYDNLTAELDRLDGFGTSAPILIQFSGLIDLDTLPGGTDRAAQILASVEADCTVCLVDASSGERIATYWRYAHDEHLLSLYPATALAPKSTYLYYVTDGLLDRAGNPVAADAAYVTLLQEVDQDPGSQTSHDTALAREAQQLGGTLDSGIVLLDRFTTQSIHEEALELRTRVLDTYAEQIETPVDSGQGGDLPHVATVLESRWIVHDYRDGDKRLIATSPTPTTAAFPFYIALPDHGTQPWPVVLIQHGLGDSREVLFKTASQMAEQGFAALAIDAPEHGERIPELTDLRGVLGRFRDSLGFWVTADRFDFQLHRIRDLFRQAAVDHQAFRTALRNTATKVLDFDNNGTADLDLETWFYYGQSMGAIIGSMTVALSPDIPAATLNVGGARLSDFTYELDVLELAQPGAESHFGSLGNLARIVSLMQTIIERADPINFARHLQREPLFADVERDLLMQFALDDGTVPNALNWQMAFQAELPLLLPSPVIPDRQLETLAPTDAVVGNLGGRTGAYVVLDAITTLDGEDETATHGNTFGSIEAAGQAACLFRSALEDNVGSIYKTGARC